MKSDLKTIAGRVLILSFLLVIVWMVITTKRRLSVVETLGEAPREDVTFGKIRSAAGRAGANNSNHWSEKELPNRSSDVESGQELPGGSTRLMDVARGPARKNFGRAWETEGRPVFANFKIWTKEYADGDESKASVEKGVKLARERRLELKELIQTDPHLAIASAVPMRVRGKLPAEVIAELEEYISGVGNLEFIGVTPSPGQAVEKSYFRLASVKGKYYEAFTYGGREIPRSKVDISLIGIAVNELMAVSESPVRELERSEIPKPETPVKTVCPISGETTSTEVNPSFKVELGTAVEVAGEVIQLCSPSHILAYEQALISSENAAGPYPGALNWGSDGPGNSGIPGRPPVSWTHGEKKVMIIRVDFSDKPGTPVDWPENVVLTEDHAVNAFNEANGIRDFFRQSSLSSFNKTTLIIEPTSAGDSPDVTEVFRMPNPASYYVTNRANTGQLHADARNAATAAGYNLANYDRIGMVTTYVGDIPGTEIMAGGLGNLQGKNFWVFGDYGFWIVAHEIGHNYGLEHANLVTVHG